MAKATQGIQGYVAAVYVRLQALVFDVPTTFCGIITPGGGRVLESLLASQGGMFTFFSKDYLRIVLFHGVQSLPTVILRGRRQENKFRKRNVNINTARLLLQQQYRYL